MKTQVLRNIKTDSTILLKQLDAVEEVLLKRKNKKTLYHNITSESIKGKIIHNENNFIVKSQMDFKRIIQLINLFDNFDLIFVEGFKSIPWIKKIKFGDLETMENTVMKFNNNIDELIKYIENELKIEKIMKKLPNFNCGECGFKTCRELAEKILINEKGFEDCKYFNPEIVMEIEINGKQIYISPFVQNIIKNTIFGMVSSLKGVNKVNTINIKIKEMDGK